MGLFDTVYCESPLPDAPHQELDFQTKDLECLLATYRITQAGRLVLQQRGRQGEPDSEVEWPLHGDLSIYTSKDSTWIEYVARFTHDRVEWIRPVEEVPRPPEVTWGVEEWNLEPLLELFKPKEAEPPSDPETALVQNLRRSRHQLETLLAGYSDHWGYEDPIYRFYHQSFKVYGLQHQTLSIRDRLQALAPDLPLNPWFVQIIESGTGKVFDAEDNARWTEVTRPILEAFFHARFFLEMAVRYANLEAPPRPLPSGYAALLELFGIR